MISCFSSRVSRIIMHLYTVSVSGAGKKEDAMYPIIDMHCDTISKIWKRRKDGETVSLRKNDMHLDLLRMKQGGYLCQCFALFTHLQHLRDAGQDPYEAAKALSDTFDTEVAANPDLVRPVTTAEQILANQKDGVISALKTIEEGAAYKGDPELVKTFYNMGVRKSTLTWNFENELAFPNRMTTDPDLGTPKMVPETEHGLKPAGKDVILLMEELGMLIDISHLGDKGIFDIFDIVKNDTPVLASHSNARAVTPHPRNLTDEMLRLIADHGGVTGINFCIAFLNENSDVSRVEDMIRHIRYIRNVGGIDMIGLGTDYDGIGGTLELKGGQDMQKLADALSLAGFTTGEIEKIFYKNVLRVYQSVLR